ncbi:MAG: hypothetical protein LBD41_07285, partial [Clostridiales Family XIII bacterium]|nr:hypothetical protein [Clostridiales Family XIII bacterium]
MAYFINKLFSKYVFDKCFTNKVYEINEYKSYFDYCKQLFNSNTNMVQYTEDNLIDKFIFPLIDKLNWSYLVEETKIISGISQKLDAVLFSNKISFENYNNKSIRDRYTYWSGIDIILECKKSSIDIDIHKNLKYTPYYQLLTYLQRSKLNYGILTNGLVWYFVDNTIVSSEPRYLAFFLDKILKDDKLQEFSFFWRTFNATNFAGGDEGDLDFIKSGFLLDQQRRKVIEENLKAVIYGSNGQFSLFEEIGRAIYQANELPSTADSLNEVFENSLYFVFRLIFIAYFEDRHQDIIDLHPGYNLISLRNIIQSITQKSNICYGWIQLKLLFGALENGEAGLKIPLFDGGLFSNEKTPLLTKTTIFSDQNLIKILNSLLKDDKNVDRDFSSLSPAHLGSIYEGLLEFEFRIADEDLEYVIIHDQKSTIEGFFDIYDINKLSKCKIDHIRKYSKGELYLVNSSNSRKTSGSYYTPDSLASPLVTSGLKRLLAGPFKDRSVLDLRVLDCACGSGHILIVALNVLARLTLERLELDVEKTLKQLLSDELSIISTNLKKMDIDTDKIDIDEFVALKRLLLKKTIYGVDVSQFAVDLAQLAFWLDTFIFGTPLSFIEHHIKRGDSLIGAEIKGLNKGKNNEKPDIFTNKFINYIEKLQQEIIVINNINDSTQSEVKNSQDKYKNEVIPESNKLNRHLNLLNYIDILRIKKITPLPDLSLALRQNEELEKTPELLEKVEKWFKESAEYQDDFHFFNWEIEFPEAFLNSDCDGPGFHLIVGNPPWDKTKFEDPIFFTRYRSNYRRLSNNQKKEIASDLLANKGIEARYSREKNRISLINEYLTVKYPYNKGPGDGNLFRFFVEKALSLLTNSGLLCYVTPTGLMTEDGSAKLRRYIFNNFRVNSFDGFENRK